MVCVSRGVLYVRVLVRDCSEPLGSVFFDGGGGVCEGFGERLSELLGRGWVGLGGGVFGEGVE